MIANLLCKTLRFLDNPQRNRCYPRKQWTRLWKSPHSDVCGELSPAAKCHLPV